MGADATATLLLDSTVVQGLLTFRGLEPGPPKEETILVGSIPHISLGNYQLKLLELKEFY